MITDYILPFILISLVIVFIWDVCQKSHSVLRTYPVIGHIRYLAETLGVYLRQYFYSNDREELPFNRTQRTWVYEAAKNIDPTIGFGSTKDVSALGSIYFIDAPFPTLTKDSIKARAITIGPYSRNPYSTNSILNISAMSYGSISKNAITALSHGAKLAGCWLNTGEGGVSDYHLSGGCDLVAQIGTAKYGYRNLDGTLSEDAVKSVSSHSQIKMFEIKISQGAKPGKGGLLPGIKVNAEIAKIRKIAPHQDSISPNRFEEIGNCAELLDFIQKIRELSGKPTGFKIVMGDHSWLYELFDEINKRGIESAPDFITLDGAEGGTGAAPSCLAGHVGLPIAVSLPLLVDILIDYNLRDRIKVIASGKLITADEVAWALCVGADFVNSARGFLFSLGCIQALRCHKNTCPTGIATHNTWLTRGLDPQDKITKVYHYAKNLEYQLGMICHSCGVHEPRELTRKHARIVTTPGKSVTLSEYYLDYYTKQKAVVPEKN